MADGNYLDFTDARATLDLFTMMRGTSTCHDLTLRAQNVRVRVARCVLEVQLGVTLALGEELDLSGAIDGEHLFAFADALHYLDVAEVHAVPVLLAALFLGLENVCQFLLSHVSHASFAAVPVGVSWQFVELTAHRRVLSMQRLWASMRLARAAPGGYAAKLIDYSSSPTARPVDYCPHVYVQGAALVSSVGLCLWSDGGLREKPAAQRLPVRTTTFRIDFQRNVLLQLLAEVRTTGDFVLDNGSTLRRVHRAVFVGSSEYAIIFLSARWTRAEGRTSLVDGCRLYLTDGELDTLVRFIYWTPTEQMSMPLLTVGNYAMFSVRFTMMWFLLGHLAEPTTPLSVELLQQLLLAPELYTSNNLHRFLNFVARKQLAARGPLLTALPEMMVAAMRCHYPTWMGYIEWARARRKSLTNTPKQRRWADRGGWWVTTNSCTRWRLLMGEDAVYARGSPRALPRRCDRCQRSSGAASTFIEYGCTCGPLDWYLICRYEPGALVRIWTSPDRPVMQVLTGDNVYRFYDTGDTWREPYWFAYLHTNDGAMTEMICEKDRCSSSGSGSGSGEEDEEEDEGIGGPADPMAVSSSGSSSGSSGSSGSGGSNGSSNGPAARGGGDEDEISDESSDV